MGRRKIETEYPRVNLGLTAMFSALMLSYWLEVGLRVQFLGSIRIEFVLAGALAVAAIVRRSLANDRIKRNRSEVADGSASIAVSALALLAVVGVGVPFSIDKSLSWQLYVDRMLKPAVIGALIAAYVVSPSTLRIHLFSLLAAFLKIGQEAFVGKITGNMVWENQGVPRLHGTQGTMFGHPNSLSGKFVSALPFVWYLYPTVKPRWVRILLVIMLLFAVNIVIFTASRTGYLTVIVAAALIVALSDKHKAKVSTAMLAAALAAVLFVPTAYKERFVSSFTGKEKEWASSSTRKALFFDSLEVFAENPLGVGLGGFKVYQAERGRNAQDTHNLYTQILAETGGQGFACFGIFMAIVLRRAMATRRALRDLVHDLESLVTTGTRDIRNVIDTELGSARLLLATTSAVIVFIVVRLSLGVFGHDFLEIYWWLAAGLVVSLRKMQHVAVNRCGDLKEIVRAMPGSTSPTTVRGARGSSGTSQRGRYSEQGSAVRRLR